jgi:hypothetical protein
MNGFGLLHQLRTEVRSMVRFGLHHQYGLKRVNLPFWLKKFELYSGKDKPDF